MIAPPLVVENFLACPMSFMIVERATESAAATAAEPALWPAAIDARARVVMWCLHAHDGYQVPTGTGALVYVL